MLAAGVLLQQDRVVRVRCAAGTGWARSPSFWPRLNVASGESPPPTVGAVSPQSIVPVKSVSWNTGVASCPSGSPRPPGTAGRAVLAALQREAPVGGRGVDGEDELVERRRVDQPPVVVTVPGVRTGVGPVTGRQRVGPDRRPPSRARARTVTSNLASMSSSAKSISLFWRAPPADQRERERLRRAVDPSAGGPDALALRLHAEAVVDQPDQPDGRRRRVRGLEGHQRRRRRQRRHAALGLDRLGERWRRPCRSAGGSGRSHRRGSCAGAARRRP